MEKQAYAISHMFHVLRDIKKNTRTGSRLPAFLFDLVGLLDTEVGAIDASDVSPASEQRAHSMPGSPTCRRESPMEQKHKFLTSTPKPEKRRQILRRVTASASHCSTVHWSQELVRRSQRCCPPPLQWRGGDSRFALVAQFSFFFSSPSPRATNGLQSFLHCSTVTRTTRTRPRTSRRSRAAQRRHLRSGNCP